MDGGAWPFLVGGVICQVNSVNERDSCLLTSTFIPWLFPMVVNGILLRGIGGNQQSHETEQ